MAITDDGQDYNALGSNFGEELKQETNGQADRIDLTDEELVALCKSRICPVCSQKQEADDSRLRALAEMDNFKKRLTREQDEFKKYASEGVITDLLPSLDNLELAIEHGKKDLACKDVVTGVALTHKMLLDALSRHGLVAVGNIGQVFDPAEHEAMGQQESAEMEAGRIMGIMQRGYRLRDRILRPARVMVSAKPQ